MKHAIALGLLTVLLVIGVRYVGILSQREVSPDTFVTFADWCRHRGSLTLEAKYTVEKLLEIAETQRCNPAESRLSRLIELDLSVAEIIDISPLASLKHLSELDLDVNQIVDVSPLANLTNLTDLILWNNRIVDISPLANLTNLTELDLKGNPLRDRTCPVQPEAICRF